VVEQNRDGQMTERVRLEVPELAGKVRPVLHYDGLPLDARSVSDEILRLERANLPVGANA